jgi:hypothetical protein
MKMNLNISMQSIGGHTELTFGDKNVVLEWKDTTVSERKALRALVEKAQTNGFETFSVGDKAGSDDELVTGSLPSVFFETAGRLSLKGEKANLKLVAEGLIDAEIKNGRLVLSLNDDNTWSVLKAEQFEAKTDGTKQKVVVQDKAVGG